MASRHPDPAPSNVSSHSAAGLLSTHKMLIGVLVGVGLVLGVSVPFARAYDATLDAQRSGYNDASAVVRMEGSLSQAGKEQVEFEVGPGESTQIGDDTFTASEGNTVVAIVGGEGGEGGLCVQVTNEDPEIRSWTYDAADFEEEYDDKPGGACG